MIPELSPAELQNKLTRENKPVTLLDVREDEEYQYCRIKGSVHIPASEIMHQIDQIDSTQEIVVVCHHGHRSLQIAYLLADSGFDQVFNLSGGIDAWTREIDPTLPKY